VPEARLGESAAGHVAFALKRGAAMSKRSIDVQRSGGPRCLTSLNEVMAIYPESPRQTPMGPNGPTPGAAAAAPTSGSQRCPQVSRLTEQAGAAGVLHGALAGGDAWPPPSPRRRGLPLMRPTLQNRR